MAVGGSGKWANFCIKKGALETMEWNEKNAGSIYRGREVGSCPEGTALITSGDRKGMCLGLAKVLSREHRALHQELR